MVQILVGKKIDQTQMFLTDGTRLPVTKIDATGNVVVQIKSQDKDGYTAYQVGFGFKKKPTKALIGHLKKANLQETSSPAFFHEIPITGEELKAGDTIVVAAVFKPGDIVKVTGTSKGKGFAGGVKRHQFKGGPRTHGQSDRERAPGSIGQTTTPGRVYKGKRMAGHMGHEKVTITNLCVLDVVENMLLVKGLIPGIRNSIVYIEKTGEEKKFIPLLKDEPVRNASQPARNDSRSVSGESDAGGEKKEENASQTQASEVAEAPVEEPKQGEKEVAVAAQNEEIPEVTEQQEEKSEEKQEQPEQAKEEEKGKEKDSHAS
ncbi:MAG: 50S ribosomal protein L3 [Candidatus Levybacteria bacterium]|nr:50S ribosomal protein L3 [Candidatus Levybacteria bacterium]